MHIYKHAPISEQRDAQLTCRSPLCKQEPHSYQGLCKKPHTSQTVCTLKVVHTTGPAHPSSCNPGLVYNTPHTSQTVCTLKVVHTTGPAHPFLLQLGSDVSQILRGTRMRCFGGTQLAQHLLKHTGKTSTRYVNNNGCITHVAAGEALQRSKEA